MELVNQYKLSAEAIEFRHGAAKVAVQNIFGVSQGFVNGSIHKFSVVGAGFAEHMRSYQGCIARVANANAQARKAFLVAVLANNIAQAIVASMAATCS